MQVLGDTASIRSRAVGWERCLKLRGDHGWQAGRLGPFAHHGVRKDDDDVERSKPGPDSRPARVDQSASPGRRGVVGPPGTVHGGRSVVDVHGGRFSLPGSRSGHRLRAPIPAGGAGPGGRLDQGTGGPGRRPLGPGGLDPASPGLPGEEGVSLLLAGTAAGPRNPPARRPDAHGPDQRAGYQAPAAPGGQVGGEPPLRKRCGRQDRRSGPWRQKWTQ